MDNDYKKKLFRTGKVDKEDCALRLTAARIAAGYSKSKDFAEVLNISATTYNSQEKGAAFPGRPAMIELHESHGIDFNFVMYGSYSFLPLPIQEGLAKALCDVLTKPDRRQS